MRKRSLVCILLFLSIIIFNSVSMAAEPVLSFEGDVDSSGDKQGEAIVPLVESETSHHVKIGNKKVTYSARAELLPLFNDKGEEMARVFYVAYRRTDGAVSRERPVTFAFNGGPGSSSLFLHLGALGPRSVKTMPEGVGLPQPPYLLEDNPDSILDVSDLVFIDPVGTGYSRASDPEKDNEKFWGVNGDIKWVSQFIRMYLTRQKRWGAPVYIAGESYGGIRATGLASELMDIGIMPSGLILISPVASYGDLVPDSSNDRPYIHELPAMVAAAWYHKKLPADLQAMKLVDLLDEVHNWARKEYLQALWKGNEISEDEYMSVVKTLARYTTLPERDIISLNLRIPSRVFLSGLLQRDRQMISTYDTRLKGPGGWYSYKEDPMFTIGGAPYYTSFMAYLLNELNFVTDREYLSSNDEVIYNWEFNSGSENFVGYPNTVDLLASAMRRSDFIKVFVAMGYYDMTCTMDSVTYTLGRLDVPAERLEKNVTVRSYDGGHMMYSNPSARKRLKADLAHFYEGK